MKPQDKHLWDKFIETHPDYFESVDYDVLVGEGMVFGDVTKNRYAADFQMLTQKKIDVVGHKGDEAHIIEIKPNAGPTAFGQIVAYKQLWTKKYPEVSNVKMVVLTNEPQSDFEGIFAANGIELIKTGYCDKCRVPENYGRS